MLDSLRGFREKCWMIGYCACATPVSIDEAKIVVKDRLSMSLS
jgi:hypothetical protein